MTSDFSGQRVQRLIALALAVGLAVSGCGGNQQDSPATSASQNVNSTVAESSGTDGSAVDASASAGSMCELLKAPEVETLFGEDLGHGKVLKDTFDKDTGCSWKKDGSLSEFFTIYKYGRAPGTNGPAGTDLMPAGVSTVDLPPPTGAEAAQVDLIPSGGRRIVGEVHVYFPDVLLAVRVSGLKFVGSQNAAIESISGENDLPPEIAAQLQAEYAVAVVAATRARTLRG